MITTHGRKHAMNRYRRTVRLGFSLVEVILSSAIFALLITALVGAYLYGQEATMLAGHRARANMLAEEGLEAIRNIRDPAYTNLANGTYGLTTTGNQWSVSGSSDVTDIFTRQVTIATVDTKRKSVTSDVTWQQNPQRTGLVSLVTRLTNWIAVGVSSGGLLIYGNSSATQAYRTYDSTTDTFSVETTGPTNSIGQTYILRTSPTINGEAVAGFVTAAGVLQIMCYNGSTWSQGWTAVLGGDGSTRPFDIAYETNSGKVIVLYSTNVGATNELAYRTKAAGSGCDVGNWSAVTNLNPIRTSGIVQWVKMAWDRRTSSNLITAIWADDQSDLSSMVWSGSVWGNEPPAALTTALQTIAASQDIENFDVEYESVSGDVMLVWGINVANNVNGVRYTTCVGGILLCAWSGLTTPPAFTDDATTLDISANPNSDELVFASIGKNQNDLQLGYWSGSTWTDTANADTSCNSLSVGEKKLSTGWLVSGATARSIVAYADQGSNNIDWYVGNLGVFTKQADASASPAPNNPNGYYEIQMNPVSKDQLLFSLSDSANDLFSKRLVMTSAPVFTWTNSDGVALTTLLPQSINSPFSFAFWRQ